MTRLIKWVGDPPLLLEDGWSVANWKYENSRCYPILLPKGHSGRVVHVWPKGQHDVSQTYEFTNSFDGLDFCTQVEDRDAAIMIQAQPLAYRDVTGERDPWKITNRPWIRTRDGRNVEATEAHMDLITKPRYTPR